MTADAPLIQPERPIRLFLLVFILVALFGIAIRVYPSSSYTTIGHDEGLYGEYVDALSKTGLTGYPDLAEEYVKTQQALPGAILPPTRFLYIFTAYLWRGATGVDSITALNNTSTLFSVLLMLVGAAVAWRLGGRAVALAVLALMSCAPTQIHMAQHGLIDGFFAFWATLAVWFLWENLRKPNDWRWLTAYTAALAAMILTKENAAFAFTGVLGLLAANRWLRFGTITLRLFLLTVAGPLAGLVALICLAGGAQTFIDTYRLLVSKASVLPYAIATGDGPWYRYLVDLLLVSPLILLLAWGALFRLRMSDKGALYLIVFVCATYLLMCNVRYGMNLRYTNMWDLPLRYLAVVCLVSIAQQIGRYRHAAFTGSIVMLCAIDLRQYYIFFVQHPLYELVTGGLLRAVKILK